MKKKQLKKISECESKGKIAAENFKTYIIGFKEKANWLLDKNPFKTIKRKGAAFKNPENTQEYERNINLTDKDYNLLLKQSIREKVDISFLVKFHKVKVIYADKSEKLFNLGNWFIFREGILKMKNCKIKFIK